MSDSDYLWEWHAFDARDTIIDAGTAWAVDEPGARRIAEACMRPGRAATVAKFRARRVVDRVHSPGDVVYVKRSPR